MAIKKSELYSSLWKNCDELRGGIYASLHQAFLAVLLLQDVLRFVGEQVLQACGILLGADKITIRSRVLTMTLLPITIKET